MKKQKKWRELRKLHVMLTAKEMAALEQFRVERGLRSLRAAVSELLRLGMDVATQPPDDSGPKS